MSHLEIEYDNKQVKKLFSNFDLMKQHTDGVFTKQVKKRFDQLRAFETFEDLLKSRLGNPHPLTGNKKGCYAISISDSKRLIIFPISESLSQESLKLCKKIIIKGVENYHGTKTTSYIP